ncbi:MAG TPA: pilus motility taxis protein HmpF [Coleofasciculaceae cyanobacterium]
MLYLAEVQRNRRGMIGGGKPDFKLLAYQRSEQSWSAVPGEDVIPAPDDASGYGTGVLVMVDLSGSKQVQRHFEAGRQLVSILQGFSRLQEKAKTQEEEIEQWKESLTYQSQELNRREMEMEARQEELQQMEAEFEKFEQQRQEIETAQAEVDRLREEFERKTQELEGAWAQLQGETNRLQERQAEFQQSAGLDAAQATYLQELLDRLSNAGVPSESIQEQVNAAFDIINHQQGLLDQHWQNFQQHQGSAQQLQGEVDWKTQELRDRWHAWHQAQTALEQARADLRAQEAALQLSQDYAQILLTQSQNQDALHQQVAQITGTVDRVNPEGLEKMSLETLQNTAKDLEKDLEKMSRFVQSQEEELTLQQEAIDELRQRMQQASEYDRMQLETELADEQDRYQMLNETLVGQRRNLQEREAVLKQHQVALARRQGHPVQEENRSVDLQPILAKIDQLRQQQSAELQDLEQKIQQLRHDIEQAQGTIQQQGIEQEAKRDELKQLEQQLQSQVAAAAELWGKVNTYQETLQPIQDNLNGLRQRTEAIANSLSQSHASSHHHVQTVTEIRETIQRLVSS